jgi:casein kinase 1
MIGNYILKDLIGSGNYGRVYHCIHSITKNNYALKIAINKDDGKTIQHETKMLKYLSEIENISKIVHFGLYKNTQYVVMNLHGINLYEYILTKDCSLIQKVNICIALLNVVKNVHQKGIVHRDLKPENFLMSIDEKTVILIDFGMAKTYLDRRGFHKPEKTTSALVGSLRYACPNSHLLKEIYRKDEFISLVYVYFFIFNHKVPWENINGEFKKKSETILNIKEIFYKDKRYLEGRNKYLSDMLIYLHSLKYDVNPNSYLMEIYINNILETT